MIDYVTTEVVDGLITREDPPLVSIYLPMVRKGAETQRNPLVLKEAHREAATRLQDKGMRRPEAESMLAPVEELIDDHTYWQNQEDGLALFVDRKGVQRFRLPIDFERLVVVGDRFHVKPLLPFLAADGEFYVLALSHNHVRLLRGSRWQVSEVELSGVPDSLKDALWYKQPEASLQSHTTRAGGALAFHGHGLGEESSEEDLREFFRQVDRGTRAVVGTQTPVVLAGVEYLHPLYRQVTGLSVLDQGVEGNPDELPAAELHARAWPLVSDVFSRRRQEAAEQIGAANTSTSLDDVVMGAAQGRVDVLFVPRDQQRWGRLDRDTLQVHLDDGEGESDLYDVAAAETWRHRGDVYMVDPAQMPGSGEVAAVFRY
ncbi:MAG: hypothetical protein ACLFWM_00255 [Actinomycetota bacterium]